MSYYFLLPCSIFDRLFFNAGFRFDPLKPKPFFELAQTSHPQPHPHSTHTRQIEKRKYVDARIRMERIYNNPSSFASMSLTPFDSSVLHPRWSTFDCGILPIDLIKLAGEGEEQLYKRKDDRDRQISPPVTLSSSSSSSSSSSFHRLRRHPIQSLTQSATSPQSTPNSTHTHSISPAHLTPIYAACSIEARMRNRTTLSYSSWVRQSASYFNATPQIAKIYFQTFLATHPSAFTQTRNTSKINGSSSTSLSTSVPPPPIRLEVDLQEFMLFLYIQRFSVFRLLHSSSTSSSSSSDSTPSDLPRNFLVSNLLDLLGWCRDMDRQSENTLTAKEFNRLGVIMQGLLRPNETEEVRYLADLTPFYTTSLATAPSPDEVISVPIPILVEWLTTQLNRPTLSLSLSMSADSDSIIMTTLDENNHPTHCDPSFTHAKKPQLSPLLPVVDLKNLNDRTIFLRRKSDDLLNSKVTPGFNGTYSFSTLSDPSPSSTKIDLMIPTGSFVHLHDSSSISLYSSLVSRFITLRNISHSILHLGVLTHGLQLINCYDCVVWVIAPTTPGAGVGSNIQLAFCKNIRIYLYTNGSVQLLNSHPSTPTGSLPSTLTNSRLDSLDARLLLPSLSLADEEDKRLNNSRITLAPYNTCYGELEADLRTVGVDMRLPLPPNSWSSWTAVEPIVLTSASSTVPTSTPSAPSSQSNSRAPSPSPSPPPPQTTSIAGGGRKGKALGQLQSAAALAASISPPPPVEPIYHTFPSLLLASSSCPISPPPASCPPHGDVSLIDPESFFPITLPCTATPSSLMQNSVKASSDSSTPVIPSTLTSPFPLPDAFVTSLRRRHAQAISNRGLIDDSRLTPSQQQSLQHLIQAEFQAWLQINYPNSYLHNLMRA